MTAEWKGYIVGKSVRNFEWEGNYRMSPARVLRSTILLALACIVATYPALAQIKTDGTLGARADLRDPAFQINEELGKRIGDNLFHSFEQFNVRTLPDGTIESARFTGPGDLVHPPRLNGRKSRSWRT